MLNIIIFFRRLLDLFVGPVRFFKSNWKESKRQQTLMLGVPAFVVAVLGLLALGISQFTRGNLESRYMGLQESENRRLVTLQNQIKNTKRDLENPEAADSDSEDGLTLEEKLEKLMEELDESKGNQRIYLQKLIDIDSTRSDYRFDLAQTWVGVNQDKHQAILRSLAPEEKTVFHKAHKLMAQEFFLKANSAKSKGQRAFYFEKAGIHADHCLTQEVDDRMAKEIRARVLQERGELRTAYEEYEELFESEPGYYLPMVQLNELRNESELNTSVVERAYGKFKARLERNEQNDTRIWVTSWSNIIRCLLIKKDYEKAIKDLQEELLSQTADEKRERQAFLRSLIGEVYSAWAGQEIEFKEMNTSERLEAIERLRESHKRNPKSPSTLNKLTWFVNNASDVSDAARKIYDPNNDPEAPPGVLSDMGARALRDRDYASAIRYFEEAITKAPESPLILNNLAYAYLVSEDVQTAERALYLIDDALTKLGDSVSGQEFKSSLYHTRGTALMQLSRMEEAAASFEKSLVDRPDHPETIEALVRCYEGRIPMLADVYRSYLKDLYARIEAEEASGS